MVKIMDNDDGVVCMCDGSRGDEYLHKPIVRNRMQSIKRKAIMTYRSLDLSCGQFLALQSYAVLNVAVSLGPWCSLQLRGIMLLEMARCVWERGCRREKERVNKKKTFHFNPLSNSLGKH